MKILKTSNIQFNICSSLLLAIMFKISVAKYIV